MLGLMLSALVKEGTLRVTFPDGSTRVFGSGSAPQAGFRLKGKATALRLALQPDLAFGEAYMDGTLIPENCGIADVLRVLILNLGQSRMPFAMRVKKVFERSWRRIAQFNPAGRSRRNVAHHYDLDAKLYDLFLDSDRQYSCAYFESPEASLETAQTAKKRHIEAKLKLDRKGLKVLDIGSGWGGLGLELARDYGCEVLGVTLSTEQIAIAKERAEKAGLFGRCRFELKDYRAVEGPFDRIVSVGMFEHVGVTQFDTFFDKVRDLLAPDGVALLHTIGRTDVPGTSNRWVTKYIFPGGYAPALSETVSAIERQGIIITDVEVLRLHYAETLKKWRERFMAQRDKAAALYDERFCRMWEFYLAVFEMCFRHDNLVVHQIQLAKRLDSLPVTRDYMVDEERARRLPSRERIARAHEAA